MVEGEKEPYSLENMILPHLTLLPLIHNIQNNFDFEKSFFSSTGSPYNHATFILLLVGKLKPHPLAHRSKGEKCCCNILFYQ